MSIQEQFWSGLNKAGLERKQHQIDAINWCLDNEIQGCTKITKCIKVKGGILADEMGLGKTTVMIGTILSNITNDIKNTLIVLPLALLDQWDIILRKWGIKPLIYHGYEKDYITKEEISESMVVLTTYGNIVKSILSKHKWDRVIYDEAHHMRNHGSKRSEAGKKLKSKIKWLVTGTPIQNYKSDLFNLLSVLGIPKSTLSIGNNNEEIQKYYILKRSKSDVGIELPPVEYHNIEGNWTDIDESELSEQIHAHLNFSCVKDKHVNKAISHLGNGHILPFLVRARQTCIYPSLIKHRVKDYVDKQLLDIEEENEEGNCNLLNGCDKKSKIDEILKILIERKDNNRSKLIFCHFKGEIDILEEIIKNGLGLSVNTFDGRTSHKERNNILTSKVDVLILQIQTGCEGLNLQQFKEVYFVSPHWNPAVESQAIARCHRIGQTDKVDVFRFIMAGFDVSSISIDRYCKLVQDKKLEMANGLDRCVAKERRPRIIIKKIKNI